jgi:hypothetical protein
MRISPELMLDADYVLHMRISPELMLDALIIVQISFGRWHIYGQYIKFMQVDWCRIISSSCVHATRIT